MKLLGLDIEIGNPFTEEDGFSPWPREKAWLTEIACVLYDTEVGEAPIRSYESLINEGKGVSPEAEEYTGISNELIEKYGESPTEVANRVLMMLKDCDYVVAQNGEEADKPWLKAFLLRYLGSDTLKDFNPPKWLDTLTDVEYPNNCRSRNLTYLNGFHGFCNPFPHRASSDVQSMMKVLFNYDLNRVIQVSESPWVYLSAAAPVDSAQGKDRGKYFTKGTPQYEEMQKWTTMLKAHKFRWDADGSQTGSKRWFKKTKQLWLDEGKEDLPFESFRLESK